MSTIRKPRPGYRELLDNRPPERINPTDHLVGAHLAARQSSARVFTMLAIAAVAGLGWLIAAGWPLG